MSKMWLFKGMHVAAQTVLCKFADFYKTHLSLLGQFVMMNPSSVVETRGLCVSRTVDRHRR